MRKEVGAQSAKHRLKYRDHRKTDNQDFERAQPAMHQNLVDHDLKEQRADKREDLKKKRSDQHLAQQVTILPYRTQEPGDVEPPREIGDRGAARHQDQATIP